MRTDHEQQEHKCDMVSKLNDLCESNVWEIKFECIDAYEMIERRENFCEINIHSFIHS